MVLDMEVMFAIEIALITTALPLQPHQPHHHHQPHHPPWPVYVVKSTTINPQLTRLQHGISRTEYHKSRNEEVKEKERKKLKDYRALVEETQQKVVRLAIVPQLKSELTTALEIL